MQFLGMRKIFTTCSNSSHLVSGRVSYETPSRHELLKRWLQLKIICDRWIFAVGDRDGRSIDLLTISLCSLRFINNIPIRHTTRWPNVGHWTLGRDRLQVTTSFFNTANPQQLFYPWEYVCVPRWTWSAIILQLIGLFASNSLYLWIYYSAYVCRLLIESNGRCDGINYHQLCIQCGQTEPRLM